MTKLPSRHLLYAFRGDPFDCGRGYGAAQAEAMAGFLRAQLQPAAPWRGYVSDCWRRLRDWDPRLAAFTEGMAAGSGHPLDDVVLLLLHEEIGHAKACTAFGATGAATVDGGAVIGQNWDWDATLYGWPHLLRLAVDGLPATLTYAFPGMWACAGLNEHGLSLVWTSSGIWPNVKPIAGIPTYALIAGILACRTAAEAVALLRRTCNAGSFIFVLADAGGALWLAEGTPGRVVAKTCPATVARGNHFEFAAACRASAQQVARGSVKQNSRCRATRMAVLLREHAGAIDAARGEAFLCDHGEKDGRTICQHGATSGMITLDSLCLLPARRELRIARGLPCRHEFARYRVEA